MKVIARIFNDYNEKFGIPRQSGLTKNDESIIIFEPEYRVPEALRGLENFSYLWLIWEFSEFKSDNWSPTVRPPRLGGNKRMGVFATRSPNRPNNVGLSSVKIKEIIKTENNGYVIKVEGADLMNGTPIYDIKPYLEYADSHPGAGNGFAENQQDFSLDVEISDSLLKSIPSEKHKALISVLSQDPRPRYIDEEEREYGMNYAGKNIKFKVKNKKLVVTSIE